MTDERGNGQDGRPALSMHLAHRARDEANAARHLAGFPEITGEMVGLHAQQAVELWLVAIIVQRDSVPARDHDLGRLVDILRALRLEPPEADRLRGLSQYAAPLQGEYFRDLEPLDRAATVILVDEVGRWAETQLNEC